MGDGFEVVDMSKETLCVLIDIISKTAQTISELEFKIAKTEDISMKNYFISCKESEEMYINDIKRDIRKMPNRSGY